MDSFLPSGGGRRALELVFQYGMRTDKRMEFEDEEEEDVDDDSCCCFWRKMKDAEDWMELLAGALCE